jgi:hypothetical protein
VWGGGHVMCVEQIRRVGERGDRRISWEAWMHMIKSHQNESQRKSVRVWTTFMWPSGGLLCTQ